VIKKRKAQSEENRFEWLKKEWRERGIESDEQEKWINIGLNYYSDYEFAEWLKNKKFKSTEDFNDDLNKDVVEKLRTEFKNEEVLREKADELLNYPLRKKKTPILLLEINKYFKKIKDKLNENKKKKNMFS